MPTMIPDRGDDPKRKVTWHVHDVKSGGYLGSVRGGQTAPKKVQGIDREVSREGHSFYPVPQNKKFL